MRRTIRLTGRRQLPVSCVELAAREVGGRQVLTLAVKDHDAFRGLTGSARVTVKLIEDKQVELVDFGTLANMRATADLVKQDFGDPVCQLRIASSRDEDKGLLLASTSSWRLNSDRSNENGSVRGLLRFQPMDIAPRAWKLEIQENAHPVIQIDRRIPDPRNWARTNPVFVAAVLPAVLERVFDDILQHQDPSDVGWMNDWLRWADSLMPGYQPPAGGDREERRIWIDGLIESFSARHSLSDRIVLSLLREEAL